MIRLAMMNASGAITDARRQPVGPGRLGDLAAERAE